MTNQSSSRPMTSATNFRVPLASNAPIDAKRSRPMDITGINFLDDEATADPDTEAKKVNSNDSLEKKMEDVEI